MRKTFFLLLLVSLPLVGCTTKTMPTSQNQAGLPNPASVYCKQQGGRLEIRTNAEGNQIGICIFTDGSECDEWSYYRAECQPQSKAEDISGGIKQLFIKKYNKPSDEVTITIGQQTKDYARGSVKFGKNGIGEGGIFLAAKVDGKWQLVFDGNGMISCSLLEKYNFPETMTTDCFDN